VKDKVHHFDIVFSCGQERMLNININSWEGQTASAGDLLDTLINSSRAVACFIGAGSVKLADYQGTWFASRPNAVTRANILVLKTFDDHESTASSAVCYRKLSRRMQYHLHYKTRTASGTKRTCLFALHMSAFDPKRTFQIGASQRLLLTQRRRRFQLRTV
jgi:hypothetical protein